MPATDPSFKFDHDRAGEYAQQSRIALAGYDACHELAACMLAAATSRLEPGAPLILACNRKPYASQPLLLAAWGQRLRMQGATPDEVEAKLGKIRQGAEPPASDEAVLQLLDEAGFERPTLFFSSLFWGAWIALHRRPS